MLPCTVYEHTALKKPPKCQAAHAGIPCALELLSSGGQSRPFTVAVSIHMVGEKATLGILHYD